MRWVEVDLAVLRAAVGLLLVAVALGTAASLTQQDLLSHPRVLVTGYLALGAAAAVLAVWRPPAQLRGERRWARCSVIAYLPALLAAAAGVLQGLSTARAAAWSFAATDPAQHLYFLADLQRLGHLDYSSEAYPRAVHMLLALVAGGEAPSGPSTSIVAYDLRLVAATTWFSVALMLLAMTALVGRMPSGSGGVQRYWFVAAAGLCWYWLSSNAFVLAFAHQAAAPSLVAVAVLLWGPIEALQREARPPVADLLILACSVPLLAHLWQPLAVVPVVAFAVEHGRRLFTAPRARLGPFAAVAALSVAALIALPPFLGLLGAGGTGLAATPGGIPAPPWWVLGLGLAATLRVVLSPRSASTRMTAGATAGLLVVAAMLLQGTGTLDLTQYYPKKALWFLTLFVSPFAASAAMSVCVATVRLLLSLTRKLRGAQRVARIALALSAAAGLFVFALPRAQMYDSVAVTVLPAREDSQGAQRMALAVQNAQAWGPATVVPVAVGSSPVFDPLASYVVSKILAVQTGQRQNHGRPWQVCEDVQQVAGTNPAVVLTSMDKSFLEGIMDRLGCGHIRVVRVPGGVNDNRSFWSKQLKAAEEKARSQGTTRPTTGGTPPR